MGFKTYHFVGVLLFWFRFFFRLLFLFLFYRSCWFNRALVVKYVAVLNRRIEEVRG